MDAAFTLLKRAAAWFELISGGAAAGIPALLLVPVRPRYTSVTAETPRGQRSLPTHTT